ncbi:MAG: single-stranded-DNA-specific exonuclease RecJ [Gammaproteobacteria bacterium]|nr:single-stranded-DNA-specific exonuclease RecJ [Gammaproteobacteria bacterium]
MLRIEERSKIPGSDHWSWPEGTHRVIRQVFSRREIKSASEIDLSLKGLRPIGEFQSLDKAVDLMIRHRDNKITIVGDFDADGATSTSLMLLCLRSFDFKNVSFFIPDRFKLGYGLTVELVEQIQSKAPELIVTVDNGVTSVAGVAAARKLGIDVLVTDHHLPGEELPAANVIINPNLVDNDFLGKNLAGVGVSFYLLAALGRRLSLSSIVPDFLDLVALGTIADLVKLDHSNRILIEQGLARIRAGCCRPGLLALCKIAKIPHHTVTGTTLAYQIAPRLNAAGRLDDMSIGVRCLLTNSPEEALSLAKQLHNFNQDRQVLESRMHAEAVDLMDAEGFIAEGELSPILCMLRDDWHEGVVGLVASKIKDKYNRPAFAFAPTESGLLKGSGRSIAGFHLRDALVAVDSQHPGLISRFGGHAMAAGLTLESTGYDLFQSAIKSFGEKSLGPEDFDEKIMTDGVLIDSELTLEVASLLNDIGPWGQGFPEPLFEGSFLLLSQRVLGDKHLKMSIQTDSNKKPLDAIAFNCSPENLQIGELLHLVYRLNVNTYYALPKIQLIVEHIQPLKFSHVSGT